jgi:hypothetical protein
MLTETEKFFIRAVVKTLENKTASWDANKAHSMYRGPNGSKCPIGHLIPDNKYSNSFENKSAHELLNIGVLPINCAPGPLIALQAAFDLAVSEAAIGGKVGNSWRYSFLVKAGLLARVFNYIMPKVDTTGKRL